VMHNSLKLLRTIYRETAIAYSSLMNVMIREKKNSS
jgi:hypothetical protein